MKTLTRMTSVPFALVAYVLSLAGFAFLGLFVYHAALAAGVALIVGLGVGAAVAYIGAAICFRVQVRQSPHRGAGTALLAAETTREAAAARAFVAEDCALRAAARRHESQPTGAVGFTRPLARATMTV